MNCFTVNGAGIFPYISTTIVKNSRDVLLQAFLVGDEQKPDLSFRWIMLSPLFEALFEDGQFPTAPLAIRSCEWGQSESRYPVIRPDRGESLGDALVKVSVPAVGDHAAVIRKTVEGVQFKASGTKTLLGVPYEEKLIVLKPDAFVTVELGPIKLKTDNDGNPVMNDKTGNQAKVMEHVSCRHVIRWNGFELVRQVIGKGRRRPDRADPFDDIRLMDHECASLIVVD